MSAVLIEVRGAKVSDAVAIADTHGEAWRAAYRGIIPGVELEKMINRRGPVWWKSALCKGSRVALLAFGDQIAGYANYGPNRARGCIGENHSIPILRGIELDLITCRTRGRARELCRFPSWCLGL